MKQGKEGIMTIFVCLLLTAMLSLAGMVIEAVRITGARIQAQAVSDSAVDSLFSEYYRPLMESYHLFFFCGAYEQTAFSETEITSHLQAYMSCNLQPEEVSVFARNTDFWKLSVQEETLTSYVLATDNACEAYRKQAADSVKMLIGEELLEKLKTWEGDAVDFNALEESYEQRNTDSDAEIARQEAAVEAAESEDSENGERAAEAAGSENGVGGDAADEMGSASEASEENPIEIIKRIKEMGILELVMENPQEVSDKQITTEDCVSHRTLQTGVYSGAQEEMRVAETLEEKVLFHEYLMRQFSSATDTDKVSLEAGTALAYELEYLIEGENADIKNLKGVVHKLLLMREAANFAYLLTDESKQMQAQALAVTITGVIGIAPLASAVKYGILLAWAYGESIMDVRSLLAGGSVSLVKSASTWQLALENIGTLLDGNTRTGEKQENGLDYENYLRLLLFAQEEDVITLRSLDLIEKNIKRQQGGAYFAADALVESLTVQTTFSISPLFFSFRFLQPYRQTFTYDAVSSDSYVPAAGGE